MLEHFPRSWKALDNPPPLRMLTEEERVLVLKPSFPKAAFTPMLANTLIAIYAKAVGYENERQIYGCMRIVGFWDYRSNRPLQSDQVITNHRSDSFDWRIGSPEWDGTKLVIRENEDNRSQLRASVYSNTPYDHSHGLADRDIRAMIYFAEMANGYLELLEA